VKTFSSVSVRIGKYPEDFECSDEVFYNYSVCSQAMIMLLLFFGQRLCFAAFKGQLSGSRIKLLDALITTVYLQLVYSVQLYLTFFKHPEVMLSAFVYCGADYLFGLTTDHQLALECMSLLFTTVVEPLFFLGRSMGCSLTSTITVRPCNSLL